MTAYDFWLILLTRRIVLVLHSATTATWTSWGSHGGVSMGIVAMLQLVPEILCSVQVRWCQPPGDAWWLHEHKWGALSSINMKLGAYWHHWVMMMGWMMSCRYDWHMTVSLKNTTSVFFCPLMLQPSLSHQLLQLHGLGPCWQLHSTHPYVSKCAAGHQSDAGWSCSQRWTSLTTIAGWSSMLLGPLQTCSMVPGIQGCHT